MDEATADIPQEIPFDPDDLHERTTIRDEREVPRWPWAIKKVWTGLGESEQEVAHTIAHSGSVALARLEGMEPGERANWQRTITSLVDAHVGLVMSRDELIDNELNGTDPRDANAAQNFMDHHWTDGRPPRGEQEQYAYSDALIELSPGAERYVALFAERAQLNTQDLAALHVTLDPRFSNHALRKGR